MHALPGAVEVINAATQRKGTIDQADARVVRYPPRSGWSWEIKLKGVDWPTLQSFIREVMLNPGCDSRLFTCIHGRTICAGFVFMQDEGILFASTLWTNTSSLCPSIQQKMDFICPATIGNMAP